VNFFYSLLCRRFAVFLSLPCFVSLITACGGGSNPISITTLVAPSDQCNLTLDAYKSLLAINSIESFQQVSEVVGCVPNKKVIITEDFEKYGSYLGSDTHIYNWTDKKSGYGFAVKAHSRDKGKTFYSFQAEAFFTQGPPNQCKIDFFDAQKLSIGQTIEEANLVLRCNGSIDYYSPTATRQISATIKWGQYGLPFLYAETLDGKVEFLSSSDRRDTGCRPTFSEWVQIAIGDDLEKISLKMKCRGALSMGISSDDKDPLHFTSSWQVDMQDPTPIKNPPPQA
jgi:hypothetical protein